MRLMSRMLFGAFIALSFSGLAIAETPSTQSSVEPGALAHATEMQLTDAFEKSTSRAGSSFLLGMAGPSSMSCSHAKTMTEHETCVVTTEGTPESAVPAALAQH